ncbi:hypothetical protein ACHWQZ_G016904 [Mnemiopsis leidyi]
MLLFLTLIISAAAFDKAVLKSGLHSAEGQLKLFKQWTENEHKNFGAKEKAFRFRVFRKHLKEIVEINESQDMYELDANFMAGLTEEEQKQWYGINITALPAEVEEADESVVLSSGPSSGSKLWREEGKVTPVKNQKSCGSCWTFGGMVAFEGHYAIQTGGLKRFSEQEFLDCTYEGEQYDGCRGGWYWTSFNMVKKTQHLSLDKDYPYVARDGACLTSSKPNGMVAAKMLETVRPKKSANDASLVQALNEGPVAMAFEIKGGFSYYKKGILSVQDCGRVPHHAMGVTGYTPEFFEIKNSWGSDWGDGGYVRFDRKIENMCGISNWLAYPKLQKTGNDTDDVTPTQDNNTTDKTCVDKDQRCQEWAEGGQCINNYSFMGQNCQKSCNICGCTDGFTDCTSWKEQGYCTQGLVEFMGVMCRESCGLCADVTCPAGLVFCDGKCQHEHFCS